MARKPGHEVCQTCQTCGLTNCPDCDTEGKACPIFHGEEERRRGEERWAVAVALHDVECPDRCEPSTMAHYVRLADAALAPVAPYRARLARVRQLVDSGPHAYIEGLPHVGVDRLRVALGDE